MFYLLTSMFFYFFFIVFHQIFAALLRIVCLLIAIAYFTLAERKVMAAVQRRRGPNIAGFWGLLQPLFDGVKLICKEMILPSSANKRVFLLAPFIILVISLSSWTLIPFGLYEPLTPSITKAEFKQTGLSLWELLKIYIESPSVREQYSDFEEADFWLFNKIIWATDNKFRRKVFKFIRPHAETFFTWFSEQIESTADFVNPYISPYTNMITTSVLAASLFIWDTIVQSYGISIKFFWMVFYFLVNEIFFNNRNLFYGLEFSATSSYGLLILLAFSSLNVYSIIIAGWASSSKYAFLGALRSASQMVAYEVILSIVVLSIVTLVGSFDLTALVWMQAQTVWFVFPLFPICIIFFIAALAETNRAPFDLPEAEAELVAGYNVEYSAIIFAMFFLAEYCNMILMSVFMALAFFGGWGLPFVGLVSSPFFSSLILSIKTVTFCLLFIIVRASFPRYRYDQLMDVGWKTLMPLATGFFLFEIGLLWTFQWLPLPFDNLPPTWYEPISPCYNPLELNTPNTEKLSEMPKIEIYDFSVNSFLYYLISAGALFCACLVLILGHPVHSLLALICFFFQLTLLMICNKIEYFGFVFLIVYIGAVSILFLFVLMLFDLSSAFQYRYPLSRQKKVFSSIFILATLKLYRLSEPQLASVCDMYAVKLNPLLGQRILHSMLFDINEIFPISVELYKFYGVPFFFIIMLLLSAMLGSIIIAMHASSDILCRYNAYSRFQVVLSKVFTSVSLSILSELRILSLKTLLRIFDFSDPRAVVLYPSQRLDWYKWNSILIQKHINTYSILAAHSVLKPIKSLKTTKLRSVL